MRGIWMMIALMATGAFADSKIGFIDAGSGSARQWAAEMVDAMLIAPNEANLSKFDVVWWHCDQVDFPSQVKDPAVIKSLRAYVEKGGGLLLTGTALAYVRDLGLETQSIRKFPEGKDDIAAGFRAFPTTAKHPLFKGLAGSVIVTPGGYPAFADFWGTSGPHGGVPLAFAYPNEGEWPIVEYALGQGRILAVGWRIPDFARGNDKFERFMHNALGYLERHKWFSLEGAKDWANRPMHFAMVPNSHGTINGWLVPWTAERKQVADILKQHLAYLREEPTYRFALSEVPNIITAMEQLSPEEWAQLRQEIKNGRVDCVNSFFLEPDTNIADGEALCQMSIQGVRWQQEVMGVTPATCWMIDTTGNNYQVPQILKKTGIGSIVFCRGNPTGNALFDWQSPDGTSVVAANWPSYAQFGGEGDPGVLFTGGLTPEKAKHALEATMQYAEAFSPIDRLFAPVGEGDYSLPPKESGVPAKAIADFNAAHPKQQFAWELPSKFFGDILKDKAALAGLPTFTGEVEYSWPAFYINMPFVKRRFRECEHLLTTAEKAATLANLYGYEYPAQDLYKCWLMLLMNMDRNTIWGAARQEVFFGDEWNATDRFDYVEKAAGRVLRDSLRALARNRKDAEPALLVFNPLSWPRTGLVEFECPAGSQIDDAATLRDEKGQDVPFALALGPDGKLKVRATLTVPALGYTAIRATPFQGVRDIVVFPEYATTVKTPFYTVEISPKTGAISSLKDKGGRELLAGESNVIIAESGADEHFPQPKQNRTVKANVEQVSPEIRVSRSRIGVTIAVKASLGGNSPLTRHITLYNDSPRIDFRTTLDWHGDGSVVSVHFRIPTHGTAIHGIPYGQIERPDGFYPTVVWSDHPTPYGGMAVFDRGIANREAYGDDVALLLLNSVPKYMGLPCDAITGHGVNVFEYSLLPHAAGYPVAQASWEYREPAVAVTVEPGTGNLPLTKSFLETGPDALVTALRREGDEQVLRLVNLTNGKTTSKLVFGYDVGGVRETNMLGVPTPQPPPARGGGVARLPLKAQEIKTLAVKAGKGTAKVKPVTKWRDLTDKVK